MLQRLDVQEGTTAEDARKSLDSELGVRGWKVPGHDALESVPEIDPRAPSWWHGDEEASSSFLSAYGITLTDEGVTPDGR